MADPCENTNTILGCQNVINQANTLASLVEGYQNTINAGLANHAEGIDNLINGNTGNTGRSGPAANHAEGSGNIINSVGNALPDESENNHVEGITSRVGGYQNHVEGCNHNINGFQCHIVGCGHITDGSRAGQNLSGYNGYFLYDKSKSFGADIYNYSNQHGGGTNASQYPGEGIDMIDKTLLNGVYPIAQHAAYRNTSDGLSYSVMLKGPQDLKEGTFVTFNCRMTKERLIEPANAGDDVIGVITKTSGFIANAGQFAASTRIKYDAFHNPIVKINYASTSETANKPCCGKNQPKESTKSAASDPVIAFPGFQTVLKDNIDRQVPFIPFTEREEYYQVTMMGLVVVRADPCSKIGAKCDVEKGRAVRGNKYWVVKVIDSEHLLILFK